IIVGTQRLGVVGDIADRVVVMYAGRKVEEAAVYELFASPQHPYTIGLLGALPRRGADRLQEIPGRVPSLTAMPDECTFAPRCARSSEQCIAREPPLASVRAQHLVACVHPGVLEEAV